MTGIGNGATDTFRSLKVRNFRLFFFGQLVSQSGTWMQSVALIWVVLQLTDDGVALGLTTAAQFLPVLLLGAWGGVIADRVDRHRFMVLSQAGFTIVGGAFAVLMVLNLLTVPIIYGLSALYGLITAMDNPTRKSLVVDLVSTDDIPNAVALNSAMMTASRVIGPSIAGLLITTVGVEWCFLLNTVTYLVVIGALLMMRRSEIREAPRSSRSKGQLREGLRYVWAQRELRSSIVLLAVIGTLAFEYQVTLPLLAERHLDAGARGFTTLYSAMSFGAVIGALTTARRRTVEIAFLVKSAWFLAATTTLLSLAPTLWLAVLAVIPVGAAMIFLISGTNALIQLRADPRMRGRALAFTTIMSIGSTPIGGPLAGFVSEHLGAPAGLMMGAIATAIVAMWVGRQPIDQSDGVTEPVARTATSLSRT